jgi:hypothetical protein
MSKLKIGDRVHVLQSPHSPCAGCVGVVIAIDVKDRYGTHLVRLDNDLRFRYSPHELQSVQALNLQTDHVRDIQVFRQEKSILGG